MEMMASEEADDDSDWWPSVPIMMYSQWHCYYSMMTHYYWNDGKVFRRALFYDVIGNWGYPLLFWWWWHWPIPDGGCSHFDGALLLSLMPFVSGVMPCDEVLPWHFGDDSQYLLLIFSLTVSIILIVIGSILFWWYSLFIVSGIIRYSGSWYWLLEAIDWRVLMMCQLIYYWWYLFVVFLCWYCCILLMVGILCPDDYIDIISESWNTNDQWLGVATIVTIIYGWPGWQCNVAIIICMSIGVMKSNNGYVFCVVAGSFFSQPGAPAFGCSPQPNTACPAWRWQLAHVAMAAAAAGPSSPANGSPSQLWLAGSLPSSPAPMAMAALMQWYRC